MTEEDLDSYDFYFSIPQFMKKKVMELIYNECKERIKSIKKEQEAI